MATVTQIKMRKPDDWHVHLREGDLLESVLPFTAACFKRALVMPNLKQAVTGASQASEYRRKIVKLSEESGFEPVMTIKLLRNTTAQNVAEAVQHAQVKAVKLYPDGVTTNSTSGIQTPLDVTDPYIYRVMVDNNMVLCIHAEDPNSFCMDREANYLNSVELLITKYPELKVVLEHVTTKAAVRFVLDHKENVAATITAHHLAITLDDIVGDKLEPHNFCKPIAKRYVDRDALRAVAFDGEEQFFLGTDSAPHERGTKECAGGCAGCFTSPMAIELLATLFDKNNSLPNLEKFMSENGANYYGFPLNEETITLTRTPWMVPGYFAGDVTPTLHIIPFMAGKTLDWTVDGGY